MTKSLKEGINRNNDSIAFKQSYEKKCTKVISILHCVISSCILILACRIMLPHRFTFVNEAFTYKGATYSKLCCSIRIVLAIYLHVWL